MLGQVREICDPLADARQRGHMDACVGVVGVFLYVIREAVLRISREDKRVDRDDGVLL